MVQRVAQDTDTSRIADITENTRHDTNENQRKCKNCKYVKKQGETRENSETNLLISTFNSRSIESNLSYIEELMGINDIIFVQETWLRDDQQAAALLDNYEITYKMFNAGRRENTKGRPSGGIGWIINKSKVDPANIKIRKVCDRLSTIELPKLVIIGIYAYYYDTRRSIETLLDQDILLNREREIVSEMKKKSSKPILIVGDFNSDIRRNDKFDQLFVRMVEDTGMICLDHMYTQR